MRLLLLSSEFPPGPGGIGTHAAAVGLQLTELGWEVTVLSRQDYASDAEVQAYNATLPFSVVRFRPVPLPPLEAAYRYLVASRAIRREKPDVLLASGERSVWLAWRLARAHGLPWIAVGHGTEFGTRRWIERALNRSAFRRANAIVCVSEYTRARMHAAGIRGRNEAVIPNGADPAVFRAQPAQFPRGPSRAPVLLTVGNVTERKGQEVVIRALPSLPGVRYEMVGLPTRATELGALAHELGVADRVEFVGRAPQEEVVRRMNACDLFVMTSRNTADGDFEGYGIAVVEAALCGKTAVVSASSGLAEAIIAGETGVLVTENDPQDTARAIRELLADDPRRTKMADAALRRALAEQTWARRAERYDAVLREALRPRGRKIVVISDTPHHRRGDTLVGWGPTVRELDRLSTLFDELVHVAPVSTDPAPANALPYESSRVRVRELKPAGGDLIVDKLAVIKRAPGYLRAALDEMRDAEVVHLRCPASISMMVAMLLPVLRRPAKRWIKYAGNWSPRGDEPWTYELQRRWLSHPWHRAVVTVNGKWPGQPPHVRPFLNPSLTDEELAEGQAAARRKTFDYPVRLLFVGRLEEAKGVRCAFEVLARLARKGYHVQLDLVGDGPLREELELAARERGLTSEVTFHGWLPHGTLAPRYAAAHLMVFPSRSEGWPKVLSEAMAFGVIPVASRVSSIPEYLLRFEIGTVAEPGDVNGFVEGVLSYVNAPERWSAESPKAVKAAEGFTYARYLERVSAMLELGPLGDAVTVTGVGEMPATRPSVETPGRVGQQEITAFWIGLILLGHGLYGILLARSSALATVHAMLVFGLALWAAMTSSLRRVAMICAYMAGSEILWRIGKAALPWEFVKYAIVLIMAITLVRVRKLKWDWAAVGYFALLLPSTLISFFEHDFEFARQQVSFNMSGPFLLAASTWFFGQLRPSRADIQRLFLALAAPIVSLAMIALTRTASLDDLTFTDASNFQTSAGYGPNQVSTVLGFGLLLVILLALLTEDRLRERLLYAAFALLLGTLSALTFSRGGLFGGLGALLIASPFLLKGARNRTVILLGAAAMVAAVQTVVLPRLDAMTGGKIVARFKDTDPTGRDVLIKSELEAFTENPIFGTGPAVLNELEASAASSHTEFSRLPAQHGTFGLVALALMFFMALRDVTSQQNASGKALALALLTWATLTMGHAAMRLAVTPLAYGMAAAHFLPQLRSRRRGTAPEPGR